MRKPPSERAGWTWTLKIAGQSYHIVTGEYPDGRLCEIFLYHRGAQIRGLVDQALRTASRALQHACGDPDEVRWIAEGWRGQQIEPRDARWRSLFDAIGRKILERYCDVDKEAQ